MLVRQIGNNKVATLKRTPKPEEMSRFDVSMFPTTQKEFRSGHWAPKVQGSKDVRIGDLTKDLGATGKDIAARIFKVRNILLLAYFK